MVASWKRQINPEGARTYVGQRLPIRICPLCIPRASAYLERENTGQVPIGAVGLLTYGQGKCGVFAWSHAFGQWPDGKVLRGKTGPSPRLLTGGCIQSSGGVQPPLALLPLRFNFKPRIVKGTGWQSGLEAHIPKYWSRKLGAHGWSCKSLKLTAVTNCGCGRCL